jgi:UDP-N-acetylmuramate: L-alanyl-gamma-D-glutamyl-meso-diaminopimelate ligase
MTRLHFHFLGICGTAMGAVAAMLRDVGHTVTGSDENVYPPMSTFLQDKGVLIQAGFKPENLPIGDCILVVGNAIKRGNPELEAALDAKRLYMSLPEVLRHYFLRGSHNLVVTGTHGKTTTTSLLAWIFEYAGLKPSYLIGGLPVDLGQGCRKQDGKYWIIEGDEYDTAYFDKRSKFVHYLPELAIINNIEFDHADIYANLEAVKTSFRQLVRILPRNGMLLVNADDPNARDVVSECQASILEIGTSPNAAIHVSNILVRGASQSFRLFDNQFELPLAGEFNLRNAAMAISAAHFYQVPMTAIVEAVQKFRGVRRRQEVRGEMKGITVIDDFGHHPTAMRETIRGLRHKYPDRRLWVLFEPRSNTTRRAVFQHELPSALSEADGVLVAQVAALDQIRPEERLQPEKVVADIQRKGVPAYYEVDADAIVARLLPLLKSGDVITVFSNGGFGGIHQKLLSAIQERL